MRFEIDNRDLEELYTKGKNKRYKFADKALLRKFIDCVNRIEAAGTINDLWTNSLQLEKLRGFENRYSVRVDLKHRLEFKIQRADSEDNGDTIFILDLSKHYE